MAGKTLAVSRLHPLVDESLLRAAFIPFGPIASINLPTTRKHRTLDAFIVQQNEFAVNDRVPIPEGSTAVNDGLAYVTFELEEDAAAAIRNRDGFPINGQAVSVGLSTSGAPSDPTAAPGGWSMVTSLA